MAGAWRCRRRLVRMKPYQDQVVAEAAWAMLKASQHSTSSFALLCSEDPLESGSDSGGSVSSTAGVYQGPKVTPRSADDL
ncbi:hypothetical protein NDU88_001946 [Pleurodeles waltl]|uniref:Uncharacterized protein n=1 Tax=Pleurodeles waltl TaxID=8319 RepID=A0AAV7NG85_PLEWA|nr:hypothetical protein NDU88_001946 [Pleurodeles waltl]